MRKEDEPVDFTVADKERLFLTLDSHTNTMKQQNAVMDTHTKQLTDIERGLYGDKINKIDGLVFDVDALKKFNVKLKLKISFIMGGMLTIYEIVKELIVSHIPGNK